MATPVIMPRQGQSVESCIISQWFKAKGDEIKKGDILFGYETDKASFEAEAETDGILLEVFYDEGDEVPVLQNVAVIGNAGESFAEFNPESRQEQNKTEISNHPEILNNQVQIETKQAVSNLESGKLKISPRAKRLAIQMGVKFDDIIGTGPYQRIIERDVVKASKSNALITPLAKVIANDLKVQIPEKGTGIGGRITSFDILASNPVYVEDAEIQKVSNVRKIIARKMHESLQNSAQLTHHASADARKMLDLRRINKEDVEKGLAESLSINDMVCYAVIKALKKNPMVNSHFLGDTVKVFRKVHLGLAVDTERGLMVPTVKNADDLSITGLASQIKELANSCKKGNINPELLASESASFTVSNLGSFGVEMFTPVINLPQVAILGVNTIINRPADLGNGVFGFVPYIGLSLTYDHRALDGAPASAFLRDIRLEIENLSI